MNAKGKPREKDTFDVGYLMILFGLLLISAVVLSTKLQIDFERDEEMKRITREGSNLSKAFEEHVYRVIQNADRLLLTIREIYTAPLEYRSLTTEVLQYFYREPLFIQAGVVDRSGRIFNTHGELFPARVLEGDNFSVHRADATEKLYISPPLPGSHYLVLSRRMSTAAGVFDGIVYVVIRAEIITDFFREMELGEDKLLVLVGKDDGIIRARQDKYGFSSAQDISNSPMVSGFRRHGFGSVTSHSLVDQVQRTQYYRVVKEYPVAVSIGISDRDYWSTFEQRRQTYWGVAALVSLSIGGFCGLLLWRVRVQEGLQRRVVENARQIATLQENTSHLVCSFRAVEDLFETIVKDACQLMGAPDGHIALLDENEEYLVIRYAQGLYQDLSGTQMPKDIGARAEVLATGKPLYIEDYRRFTRRLDNKMLDLVTTLMVFPLKHGDRVIGTFSVSWRDGVVQLSQEDRNILAQYSDLASVALDNVLMSRCLEQANEDLEHLASTDRLTSAWNRRRFEQMAEIAVAEGNRYHQPLSFLLLDIDHFKGINDQFGHPVGDLVLRELVNLIQKNIRLSDSVSRWGGEEFALILPHTPAQSAIMLGEKLRRLVEEYDFPKVGRVTVSMGVAELTPGETWETMVERADSKLYIAKKEGRNRVIG